MSKPTLKPEFAALENAMLETFLAGHNLWRPDLPYPESHSDMQAGLRALLKRFEIKPRPIPLDWSELVEEKTSSNSSSNSSYAGD